MNKRIILLSGILFITGENFLISHALKATYDNCETIYNAYKEMCSLTKSEKKALMAQRRKGNQGLSYGTPTGRKYIQHYEELANLCYLSHHIYGCQHPVYIHPTMPGCDGSRLELEHVENCDHPELPAENALTK